MQSLNFDHVNASCDRQFLKKKNSKKSKSKKESRTSKSRRKRTTAREEHDVEQRSLSRPGESLPLSSQHNAGNTSKSTVYQAETQSRENEERQLPSTIDKVEKESLYPKEHYREEEPVLTNRSSSELRSRMGPPDSCVPLGDCSSAKNAINQYKRDTKAQPRPKSGKREHQIVIENSAAGSQSHRNSNKTRGR